MPTFVTLLQWTQKGIENVKEGPSRLDQAREALKAVGGELKASDHPSFMMESATSLSSD